MKDEVRLTREQLFELVWSTPVSKLAARFGISDVALAKRCKRLDIPRPGLGHWARVAAGQKLERPKLPAPPRNLEPWELTICFPAASREKAVHEPQLPPPPEVPVPATLRSPHHVALELRSELAKAKRDHNGLLRVSETRATDTAIKIGPDSIARALRIFDALFEALEARGHTIELRERGWEKTQHIVVVADDETIELSMEEIVGRTPHVPTEQEKRNNQVWGSQIPVHDGFPSGQLKLRVHGLQSWSDTKRHRLDDLLGHAVLGVERAARSSRRHRIERERVEAERQAQERKRIRTERLHWYEMFLADNLERMAASWKKARELRSFLAAYEEALGNEERDAVTKDWIAAATAYIESLDPLNAPERVAAELEPDDDVLAKLWAQYGPERRDRQQQ